MFKERKKPGTKRNLNIFQNTYCLRLTNPTLSNKWASTCFSALQRHPSLHYCERASVCFGRLFRQCSISDHLMTWGKINCCGNLEWFLQKHMSGWHDMAEKKSDKIYGYRPRLCKNVTQREAHSIPFSRIDNWLQKTGQLSVRSLGQANARPCQTLIFKKHPENNLFEKCPFCM